MLDRIADIWGARTPFAQGERWPIRVDMKLADGLTPDAVDRWVSSACVLCSNGCAVDIAVKDGRMGGVRGRATDIVNHGRLGPKGLFGNWQGMRGEEATRAARRRRAVRVADEGAEGLAPDTDQAGRAPVAPGGLVSTRPSAGCRRPAVECPHAGARGAVVGATPVLEGTGRAL